MRIAASCRVCCVLSLAIYSIVRPDVAHAADRITLIAGPIIEGDITVEDERNIKLRVNGRLMTFPRGTVATIDYGPDSTAPSQVQQRQEDSEAELKEAQKKVKSIKIKHRKKKKKKKKKEEAAPVVQGVAADGTLIIPPQASPEEEKWITELRSGKNKVGAARNLARLKSVIAIPDLINALDAPDVGGKVLRRTANDALKAITQQDFGYRWDQRNRSVRVDAIKRWRKWYEKASGKKVPWSRI